MPQFISLLYVSKLFDTNGVVNAMLLKLGFINQAIRFWENTTSARILVIVINIWVGIPYTVMSVTGILKNIPAEQYEAARIDGANAAQQFTNITLPYMFFVMTPTLITTFTSNINNFNVIYLLSKGDPTYVGDTAGQTDLLVTWLYKLTVNDLLALDGFQQKRAENLVAALDKSRHCTLDAFLFAIGIPNVGRKTARDLAEHFGFAEAGEKYKEAKARTKAMIKQKACPFRFTSAKASSISCCSLPRLSVLTLASVLSVLPLKASMTKATAVLRRYSST